MEVGNSARHSIDIGAITSSLGTARTSVEEHRHHSHRPISPNQMDTVIELSTLQADHTSNISQNEHASQTATITLPENQAPPVSSNHAQSLTRWVENNSDRLLLTAMVGYQLTATVAGGMAGRHYLPFEDKSVRMAAGALGAYAAAPLASSFVAWATGHSSAAKVLGLAPFAPFAATASLIASRFNRGGEGLARWIRHNETSVAVAGMCIYQLSAAVGGAVAGNRYLSITNPDVRMGVGAAAGYAVAPLVSSFAAWASGHPNAALHLLVWPYVAAVRAATG